MGIPRCLTSIPIKSRWSHCTLQMEKQPPELWWFFFFQMNLLFWNNFRFLENCKDSPHSFHIPLIHFPWCYHLRLSSLLTKLQTLGPNFPTPQTFDLFQGLLQDTTLHLVEFCFEAHAFIGKITERKGNPCWVFRIRTNNSQGLAHISPILCLYSQPKGLTDQTVVPKRKFQDFCYCCNCKMHFLL